MHVAGVDVCRSRGIVGEGCDPEGSNPPGCSLGAHSQQADKHQHHHQHCAQCCSYRGIKIRPQSLPRSASAFFANDMLQHAMNCSCCSNNLAGAGPCTIPGHLEILQAPVCTAETGVLLGVHVLREHMQVSQSTSICMRFPEVFCRYMQRWHHQSFKSDQFLHYMEAR